MRVIIVAALLAAVIPVRVDAGTASAGINVSATVVARAVVLSDDHPSEIVIQPRDLERGYIDVEASMRVRTNDRFGFLMIFTPMSDAFWRATLRLDSETIEIAGSEAFVQQPFSGLAPRDLKLGYRLYLRPDLSSGSYAWPISRAVLPRSVADAH